MKEMNFISTETLCLHYNIEVSFVNDLHDIGLLHFEFIDQNQCIHQDQIGNLEKMIRLHHELNVNLEGIDVIFNLLEKEKELRNEVINLRNKLKLYENIP